MLFSTVLSQNTEKRVWAEENHLKMAQSAEINFIAMYYTYTIKKQVLKSMYF
jgi:hypothetical protein